MISARRNSLYSLLFTIFNDSLGWGIVLTIFAPLFFDPSKGLLVGVSDALRNIVLGLFIGSYAITQFFAMPLIGALSDHFGRKKILQWTILGAMASFALSALAIRWNSLFVLFLARLAAGFFSGNASTAQASVADMSTETTKAKNLSLTSMVASIAWIAGPPLGGFLAMSQWVAWFDFSTPFWFLTLSFLLNFIWVNKSYVETYEKKGKHDWKQEIKDLATLSKIPQMKGWLFVAFFFYFGWFFYVLFYPTFLVQEFQFGPREIGLFSAYLSVFWMVGSFCVNRWLGGEKVAPSSIIVIAFPLLAFLLFFAALETSVVAWSVFFPFLAFCGSMVWIHIMALTSNLAGEKNQGKSFGLLQSLSSLALFVAPLWTGFLAAYNIHLPFFFGSLVFLGGGFFAFALTLRRRQFNIRK